MRKTGLISSNNSVPSTKDMQVLDKQSKAYFNFINSVKSESTKKSYRLCLVKFLNQYQIETDIEKEFINTDLKELIMINKKILISKERLIDTVLTTYGLFNDPRYQMPKLWQLEPMLWMNFPFA